ncbi:hypothetical protein CgunFtcFv8_013712 [Champsocephalus gunnari]|uniref:CCHC-type domain-containing protein n=1 Tax=Champsocephalus gunnari TaxID=52237 RepID=A0AAN8DUP3_CHAGU|nr:hypothetical protein CgunFtcFv8_013712 [Champsocephalus gunnari]
MWPGTDVVDGTRFLRVEFNKEVQSLPYSTRFETLEGPEYFRVIHDKPVPVCRMCLRPGHLYKECPQFRCHKCAKQGHYARDCVTREEGASGARGRESAQAENTVENGMEEEEGGSQEESEEEDIRDKAGSRINEEAVAAVAAVFVAAAAKRAADAADMDGGGDGGRKKGKADEGKMCSSRANTAAVPAAADDGQTARSGEGLAETEVEAVVDVILGAETDTEAEADVEGEPDPEAGGGAVGGRRGGGGEGGGGQTAEGMEVSSVVSDMEEGGDDEENESEDEEVKMIGPIEEKIFGEAGLKSRGMRRESSRLNAKRKADKEKAVERRRAKATGEVAKCSDKK